jgi:hypothetical protein
MNKPTFPLLSMDDLHGYYAKTGDKETAWAMLVDNWGNKPPGWKEIMLGRLAKD